MTDSIATRRPAETTAAVIGTGGLVAAISAGNALAIACAAIGYVPAVVTYLYDNGGLAGIVHSLWRGR